MGLGTSTAAADQLVAVTAPTRVHEAGDGNCLFHALARQCLGSSHLAWQVRREICDWMGLNLLPSAIRAGTSTVSSAHCEEISRTMSDIVNPYGEDQAVLQYIEHMRQPGAWGSGLEALCASYCYTRRVAIWSDDSQEHFSSRDTASILAPPGITADPPVGLLHVGRTHWDSVLLPSAWEVSAAGAFKMVGVMRLSPEEVAADRAFQQEDVARLHDASRDEVERRAHRERIAARYEQAAARSAPRAPRGRNSRQFQRGVASLSSPKPALKSAPESTTKAAAHQRSDAVVEHPHRQEAEQAQCRDALVRMGLSQGEAMEAVAACNGNVDRVKSLYNLQLETSAEEPALAAQEVLNEQCIVALARVGLSEVEAMEAITACNGDIERVKALYGVDWNPAAQQTVQTIFERT